MRHPIFQAIAVEPDLDKSKSQAIILHKNLGRAIEPEVGWVIWIACDREA